jgi:hypothetical protein
MNIPSWRIYTDRRILVLTGLGLFLRSALVAYSYNINLLAYSRGHFD